MTWRNQLFSRYRCRDCMSQFWVISHKTYVVAAVLISAVLVAALAVFVLGIVFDPDNATPGRRRSDAMPFPHQLPHPTGVVVTQFAATLNAPSRSQS